MKLEEVTKQPVQRYGLQPHPSMRVSARRKPDPELAASLEKAKKEAEARKKAKAERIKNDPQTQTLLKSMKQARKN